MTDKTLEPASLIKRCGTPVNEMEENELPSPVMKADDSNVKLLPFSFLSQAFAKSNKRDAHYEANSGAELRRKMKRLMGFPNYLKEFQDKL